MRWFQFRFRTLLALTAACTMLFALWAAYLMPYRAQQRGITAITKLGGRVVTEPVGPVWLRRFAGEKYLVSATEMHLFSRAQLTDDDLQHFSAATMPCIRRPVSCTALTLERGHRIPQAIPRPPIAAPATAG